MKPSKILSFFVVVATLLILSPSKAYAQAEPEKGSNALGVMLGDPTGISFKHWNNSKTALNFGLAWSLDNSEYISLHGDHLWHSWIDVESGQLAFYYGIGARGVFGDGFTVVGARIPLGLNYLFENSPVDLFIEAVPVIDILPNTDADGNGAIGARFYF